jgi:CHAD domain-containing protein
VNTADKTTGLRYWMLRVLEECEHVSSGFSADPVHDLRVSLRRCRSMADGLMAIDPDPGWKEMRKAGKQLFQRLGALRDIQVMMDWIDKIWADKIWTDKALPENETRASGFELVDESANNIFDPVHGEPQGARDPASRALFAILRDRESEQKREARAALDEFDRKQWRQWARALPQRAAHIRPGSAVFKHLALERWTMARELHTRALRNRSQVAFHTLRIGIKRFRYIVENFLPTENKLWSGDLKHMQDLLGEVHDLDVLWSTALNCHVFSESASRQRWHARILEERTRRIDEYREKTVGPHSLWERWRAGLPQGKQIQQIATQRMKLWGKTLDPDFAHSERVARLSLELYDGLNKANLLGLADPTHAKETRNAQSNGTISSPRASLYAAALLHDVGKSKRNKGHHKESRDLISKHGAPLGWNEDDMRRAAIIARFHCGALPTRSHKQLRDLLSDEQKIVIRLSAILRLANALDSAHDGHIRRVKVEDAITSSRNHQRRSNGFRQKAASLAKNEALVISAEGYAPQSPTAQSVAAERYLLETVLRRPVIVKPLHILARS